MATRERLSTQDMGFSGVIDSNEKARLAHEQSRDYMNEIGAYSKKEARFKSELKATYQMSDDEVDEIIRMFKGGVIEYKIYLEYGDIVRDKLAVIREKKYTDI